MKLVVLHLCDLHITNNFNYAEKAESLFDSIKNELFGISTIFVVSAGDIALTGKTEEYEIAYNFYRAIKNSIEAYIKDIEVVFIFAPGNHDCNMSKIGCKEDILANIKVNSFKNLESRHVEEFHSFTDKFYSANLKKITVVDGLIHKYEFTKYNKKISFNILNSALMSTKNEKTGELFFPYDKFDINSSISFAENFDIAISVMHHPLNWFLPQHSTALKYFLKDRSHFILTGHEHVDDVENRQNRNGDNILFISGGIFSNMKTPASFFNVLRIDINCNVENCAVFAFDSATSLYVKQKENTINNFPLVRKKLFNLNQEYLKKIIDPGMSISHPYKDNINLADIYIYPNIKTFGAEKANKEITERANKLTSFSSDGQLYCYLFGDNLAGKTSLLRMLQMHFNKDGLIPILINGSDIKNVEIESFVELLKRNFKKQYRQEDMPNFESSDKNKWIILIDNYDYSPLAINSKSGFLLRIKDSFKGIIITSSIDFSAEMYTSNDFGEISKTYSFYEIVEFGYKLRDEFIENWLKIGRESQFDIEHNLGAKDEIAKTIDSSLGENYIPAFPFFLLTLLQVSETHNSNLIQGSSYGHYYQYLITESLMKNGISKDELDNYFTYLSYLAYSLFSSKKQTVSLEDLRAITKAYCSGYCETIESKNNFNLFVKARILTEEGEQYKFSYDYLRYYFISKYLSDNLSKPSIILIVQKLCERLYRVEFSNIIMFLVHHTKNEFLLQEILTHSKKNFANLNVATLDRETTSCINNLIDQEMDVYFEEKNILEHRKDKLETKDTLKNKFAKNSNQAADIEEDIADLSIFKQINMTIKTVEIMGQILKSYSFEKDIKYKMAEESFSATLRALTSFINFIEENKEIVINKLENMQQKESLISQANMRAKAKAFMFNLASMGSYAFIIRTARYLSAKKLNELGRDISDTAGHPSFKLIYTAMKLDIENGLNADDIIKFYESQKGNYLSQFLLRVMVIQHLYMYKIKYNVKSKILTSLNISNDVEKKANFLDKKNK